MFKNGEESREMINKRCYFLPREGEIDNNLPEDLSTKNVWSSSTRTVFTSNRYF